MKNQPYLAKERIFRELHPVYVPRPRKPGAGAPKSKPPSPTDPATNPGPSETVKPTPQKP